MNLRTKIIMTIAFSAISCLCAYFIITKLFDNLENELYEKCHIEALTGARSMSEIMKFMIKYSMLTKADIFDTNYIQIPGTNPPKYHTRYDRTFDKWIQGIEDQFLNDTDIEFAVLMDKNGYVPTHNSKYSKSQTSNYNQDIIYSRSKRKFISYRGIKKILDYHGDDTIRVLYHRDTGETLWNIGAPVRLDGQQWGSFIIGVNLERIGNIKNQMLILIIIAMSIILATTNLVILAIIPRKYLHLKNQIHGGNDIL
jgi:hypothetical protein